MTTRHALGPGTPAGNLTALAAGTDLIVTGEAVALEVRPASVLSRVLAFALDAALYLGVGVAGLVVLANLPGWDDASRAAAAISLLALVMVGLPTAVETATRGRSLGKMAAGLVIVRDDGGPVRFRQALVRALVGIGEVWLTTGAVALLSAILHPRGKRLGDIAAGTYCARLRGGEPPRPPLVMPAELAAWAARADIRTLPDGLALAARRFLGRADRLHPRSREALGRSLAAAVEPLVAPPPPWGTPPERFLAAVLVARRDREYALGRAARLRAEADGARLRRLPFGLGAPHPERGGPADDPRSRSAARGRSGDQR